MKPNIAARLLVAAICALSASHAAAQEFPTKPIRFVVATAAGGGTDILARIIAPEMAKFLGQPVVVENRPGANNALGTEFVAKQAPADGYTMIVVAAAILATFPVMVKDLRFDPIKDLVPFIGLGENRYLLVTSTQAPFKTFNEMVAHARANPGKLNFGSGTQLTTLLWAAVTRDLNIDVQTVPYPSTAPIVRALLAGEVQLGVLGALPGEDRLKLIATSGEQRRPGSPDVPTFAELGFPKIQGINYMLSVRAGTPKVAIDRLHDAASRTLRLPEMKAVFEKNYLDLNEQTPAVVMRKLEDEAQLFASIAKRAGIEPK